MKPVYESRFQLGTKTRAGAIATIVFTVVTILAVLGMTILFFPYLPEALDGSLWSVMSLIAMLGVLLWLLLSLSYALCTGCTAIRVETDGLWLRPPFRRERCIPWDGFRRVCVCNTDGGKSCVNPPAIFCVEHRAAAFPQQILPPMLSTWPFSRRGVIAINYSDALLEGLRERCPLPVEDLR